MWYFAPMGTFWMIAASAVGYGIGFAILERMAAKYGKVPWWFRAFWIAVGIGVVYLGLVSLGAFGERPCWAVTYC